MPPTTQKTSAVHAAATAPRPPVATLIDEVTSEPGGPLTTNVKTTPIATPTQGITPPPATTPTATLTPVKEFHGEMHSNNSARLVKLKF